MCGITGCFDTSPGGEDTVEWLNRRQAHRGPDDAVVSRAGPYVVGNTRLAIQDPTPSGNQPFWSEDGRYCAVFNGEIYNFREIVDDFGLQPGIKCDGAVIPELWSRMGPDCLPLLRGMYGIAVVDLEAGVLWLARDPFGIKPLHWRNYAEGKMAFASEPRVLAGLRPSAAVSHKAVAHFLRWGAIAADGSPFEGIEAVRPNECVRFEATELISREPILGEGLSWFAALDPGHDRDVDLAEAFRASVDLHLRSDVPTVLLLSGGVDSAAVACMAQALGHRLRCMTVAGLSDADDEAPGAAKTAHRYGHDHEVVPAELDEATVNRFFASMQRPTIDGLNTFLISRAVRAAGFKVALSGLGADEGLGGYGHFRIVKRLGLLRLAHSVPPTVTRRALGLAQGVWSAASRPKARRLLERGGPEDSWDLDRLVREVISPEAVVRLTGTASCDDDTECPAEVRSLSPAKALVAAELSLYLQAVLLPDTDAFSMANSVELRVPFLDTHFFPAAVNTMAMARGLRGKRSLADALGDPYLQNLTAQPKKGFTLPMVRWARNGALKPLIDALDGASAPVWDYVDRAEAASIYGPGQAPHSDEGLPAAWPFVVLNNWLISLRSADLPTGPGLPLKGPLGPGLPLQGPLGPGGA